MSEASDWTIEECPKCQGTGEIKKPTGAYQDSDYSMCNTCNGSGRVRENQKTGEIRPAG